MFYQRIKPRTRLILVAALLRMSAAPSPAANLEGRDPLRIKQPIQIRVFNSARVPGRDLSRAQTEVARIFREAGMEVAWADGALDDHESLTKDFSANNFSASGCTAPSHARELRVQLIAQAPSGSALNTLGFALPCAAFGLDSMVYIDRCESVTYHTPVTFSKVLAYAMAHELGHVLLRSSQHTQAGLMRALWDKSDWMRAAAGAMPIDAEQALRMRAELSGRAATQSR
jgi:hypothetical protein